jgi:hypothetical protein
MKRCCALATIQIGFIPIGPRPKSSQHPGERKPQSSRTVEHSEVMANGTRSPTPARPHLTIRSHIFLITSENSSRSPTGHNMACGAKGFERNRLCRLANLPPRSNSRQPKASHLVPESRARHAKQGRSLTQFAAGLPDRLLDLNSFRALACLCQARNPIWR